jgi:hypothetical protein
MIRIFDFILGHQPQRLDGVHLTSVELDRESNKIGIFFDNSSTFSEYQHICAYFRRLPFEKIFRIGCSNE